MSPELSRQAGRDEAKSRLAGRAISRSADKALFASDPQNEIKLLLLKLVDSKYEFERSVAKTIVYGFKQNFKYNYKSCNSVEDQIIPLCSNGEVAYIEENVYEYDDIYNEYYRNCAINKADFYKSLIRN